MSRNYLEKWASRDEDGPYKNVIIISENEPRLNMGKFTWELGIKQQYYVIGINDTDLCLQPGQKTPVKMFVIPSE